MPWCRECCTSEASGARCVAGVARVARVAEVEGEEPRMRVFCVGPERPARKETVRGIQLMRGREELVGAGLQADPAVAAGARFVEDLA